MIIHGKIIQSISQMNSFYDFVIEIQNERNEDNGTKKRIFGALDDLMRSPIGERLRERMFRELSTKRYMICYRKSRNPIKN